MEYHLYQDKANEWRWSLVADNYRKIADSAEGYKNEADCRAAIEARFAFRACTTRGSAIADLPVCLEILMGSRAGG